MQEIVVTARKREEDLQNVPVAITAFTSQDMARRQFAGLSDIAAQTPGFSFEAYATAALQTPVIRGQAQNFLTSPVQNVSTFFDGVYLQRGYMIDSGLVDMERIEILKGPQSSLYGQNAFAGAISYVSRKPSDALEIDGSITAGNNERLDIKAGIGGPIVEDLLAMRLGIGMNRYDGSWKNNHPLADADVSPGTKGNVGGYDNRAVNVGVLFTPTDRLSIEGGYYRAKIDAEVPAQYSLFGQRAVALLLLSDVNDLNCSPTTQVGQFGNNLWCGRLPDKPEDVPGAGVTRSADDPVIDPRSFGQLGTNEIYRASLDFELTSQVALFYQFGRAKSDVTSGRQSVRDAVTGMPSGAIFGLGSGRIIFDAQPNGQLTSNSHELRIQYDDGGAWVGMLGAYYYESTDFYAARNYRPLALETTPLPQLPLALPGNFTILDDEVRALYGSLEYSTGPWSFSGEVRYNDEKKRRFTAPDPANLGPEFYGNFPAVPDTPDLPAGDFNYLTPRFSVTYRLSDANLVYASAARGGKAGGFNSATIFPENQTYDPEFNWTYEVGSKNTLMNGQLQLNLAAFYIDWSDMQITGREADAPLTAPAVITNLAGASTLGGELQGVYRPIDQLHLSLALSYVDPKLDSDVIYLEAARDNWCSPEVCDPAGAIGGNTLPRTPRVQAAAGAEWTDQLTPGISYFLRSDVSYQGKQYSELLNAGWAGGRTLVDGSVGLVAEHWEVQLWAKNLLDRQYASSTLFGGSFIYGVTFGERLAYGITATYRY